MVDSNTVIDDRSPQAANSSLEKTTNSRSPDIHWQDINEDIRQIHKTYHFQNCGTVYMPVDSFNARGVRMENCSNNIPQITYRRPRIIDDEKVLHSQSREVTNDPQNATGPPTVPSENAKSSHGNVHLQTNALSPPPSPQPQAISPSHISGNHTHHNVKYLEQLLDSSLATVAVIQFSGNTLADVLTPRAYDTLKALYSVTALDAPVSSTKPEIPTRPTFSDIDNASPYSSNHSSPLPNSSHAVPRTGRMHAHISIYVHYVMLFSWAGLAIVSCLVAFFNLPRLCERDVSGHF